MRGVYHSLAHEENHLCISLRSPSLYVVTITKHAHAYTHQIQTIENGVPLM